MTNLADHVLRSFVGPTVCAALVISVAVAVPPSVAAESMTGRTERRIESSSPVTGVVATVVGLDAPLPADFGPHPAECDRLSYLRYRAADGPEDSEDADRVLVAQPGIFEGAGAFESVARNTVAAADAEGRHIEFWALDRRSNCLEDHTGTQAALAANDLDIATDYYFGGGTADGRTFAGYADGVGTAWLKDQGLAQTMRDQYDVLRLEFPDQAVRKQKVLCGGHSLGGFLTGYFANWDFDGNPATTDDIGYNQCSGYFALDTVIKAGPPNPVRNFEIPEVPPSLAAPLEAASGALTDVYPVTRLPAVINPETTNLLAMAGLAARLNPTGINDIVDRLPHSLNFDTTLRTLLSKDPLMAATGRPDVRTLYATNDAVVGALLDDNSQPLGFLQTSVGFIGGGPVQDKYFPMPNQVIATIPFLGQLFGSDRKAAPTSYGDPSVVYTWQDYDEMTPNDYTDPSKEVTSISQIARSLSEPPLDFTEWYFPTAITTDLGQPTSPSIAAHYLHRDGVSRNPVLTLQGDGGLDLGASDSPNDVPITLHGYNHLDVLTAAQKQNDGLPEQVSTRLAAFSR
ncbi:hypothetical protein ASG84_19485 [Rhodococcus sp. Leaf278]|uniref:hypothetical protein n=1 Tax=Rhodococcus sp. Leaf278 TaxID=1736319 RepID=UPI00070E5187|nr:hypothetical protein [Rhodococcus sp. Leaf278]KQU56838.1 hypothetical protein ASG84_19485 [Rhodococcus sp. Leaf278]